MPAHQGTTVADAQSWTLTEVCNAVSRAEPVYTNTGGGWSIRPAEELIPVSDVAGILFAAYGNSRVTVEQLASIDWYNGARDFRGSAAAPHHVTGEGGDRIAEQLVAALLE